MSKYYLGNTGEELPEQLNLDTDATSPVQFRSDADALPETDNTWDLGSASYRFAQANAVNVIATSGLFAGVAIGPAGAKQLHIDGQDAIPQTDNSFNLGSAARRLANAFAAKVTTASGVITGLDVGPAGAKQLHIDGQDAVPQADNSFVVGKSTRRLAQLHAAKGVFGTGVANPSGVIEGKGDATFTNVRTPSEAITSAGTIASVDLSRSNMFRLNLNHDATITALSNGKDGAEYTILIKNVKPSGTLAWPANVVWAAGSTPTITKPLNKYDLVTLKYFAGVDKFFGTISQNYT